MAGGGQQGEAVTLEYTPTWVVALVCTVIVGLSLFAERILHYAGKVCFILLSSHPSSSSHFHFFYSSLSVFINLIALLLLLPLLIMLRLILIMSITVFAQEEPETSLSGLAQNQRRSVVYPILLLLIIIHLFISPILLINNNLQLVFICLTSIFFS